jgi:two-component system phosphate regulon sensor histidine kinase PhoR
VWLTVHLLEQDRNIELQRHRDRLAAIADFAMAQLKVTYDEWYSGLNDIQALPSSSPMIARFPKGSTFILISEDSVVIYPRRPLIFTPDRPAAAAHLQTGTFEAADEFEFRRQEYDRALETLRPLSMAPSTRLEALLRIARIEYKAGKKQASLDHYGRLSREDGLNQSGTPYALLASTARCRILLELGRTREASAEAERLRSALLDGRWPLSREAFEYNWSQLSRFGISAGQPPQASIDLAMTVASLNDVWQLAHKSPNTSFYGSERTPNQVSPITYEVTAHRLIAVVLPPDWIRAALRLPPNSDDIRWNVVPPGKRSGAAITVTRSPPMQEVGGDLEFSSIVPASGIAPGRSLLLGGGTLMLVLILGSGYVVHRAISRELQVAQLQSDFVAAVSHEFRSPLTTLRTITELLAQDRIPDESRRRQSYIFLDRETNRLHRLVEDLLDFGRMESGRRPYRMETLDAFQLVRAAVSDVGEHAAAGGFRVETILDSARAPVRADEEAFRRTLRNLLENAMKYSPECRTVWVEGAIGGRQVSISVRDRGMGIDATEQQAIFDKFVRGQAAKRAGIKGTGIGLAMVRQITAAMGGEIRLQSEPGVGSTFTLLFPLAED